MKRVNACVLLLALPAGLAFAGDNAHTEGSAAGGAEAQMSIDSMVDDGSMKDGMMDDGGGLSGSAGANANANANVVTGWDSNGDGVISKSEWMAQFDPKSNNMKDLNGDGTVSANEFAKQLFQHADESGDGKLTDDEITTGFLDTQR